MLNKETESTNRSIDFVTFYGEYAAGCNERFIEWDVKKVLEEGWTNEYIGWGGREYTHYETVDSTNQLIRVLMPDSGTLTVAMWFP